VQSTPDGTPFGPQDARLVLGNGRVTRALGRTGGAHTRRSTPRFFCMRLSNWSDLHFPRITQHLRSSQTLAALGPTPWYLAVAPAGPLRPQDIVAFEVSPPDALSLHLGTWHSGCGARRERRRQRALTLPAAPTSRKRSATSVRPLAHQSTSSVIAQRRG
jgi:hypothetical protein